MMNTIRTDGDVMANIAVHLLLRISNIAIHLLPKTCADRLLTPQARTILINSIFCINNYIMFLDNCIGASALLPTITLSEA
jgi:hypothetical protein